MRIGKLDKRITLQKPAVPGTQGTDGAMAQAWTTVASAAADGKWWASIEPIRGAELLRAGQNLGAMDTRIRLRHAGVLAGLDATWRAVHGSTVYNIVSPVNVALANREFELMCQTGMNEG